MQFNLLYKACFLTWEENQNAQKEPPKHKQNTLCSPQGGGENQTPNTGRGDTQRKETIIYSLAHISFPVTKTDQL